MTKTKLIFVGCFLLAFIAGAALGALVLRLRQPPARHSFLEDQLNLTPQQTEKSQALWGDVYRQMRDRRAAMTQERNQKIDALLSESQKSAYDAIRQESSEKLDRENKRAFEEAAHRMREILTPEQAAKYDQILKERSDRGDGPPGFRGPRRRASSSSTSRSTIDERPVSRVGD
jgi:Spy/CpxP family protein refolding chaperone